MKKVNWFNNISVIVMILVLITLAGCASGTYTVEKAAVETLRSHYEGPYPDLKARLAELFYGKRGPTEREYAAVQAGFRSFDVDVAVFADSLEDNDGAGRLLDIVLEAAGVGSIGDLFKGTGSGDPATAARIAEMEQMIRSNSVAMQRLAASMEELKDIMAGAEELIAGLSDK